MLDRLPPLVRHLSLLLIAAALTWAGTDLVPWLQSNPGWGALAGSLATVLLAWATPLVGTYGVGSRRGGRPNARPGLGR